ncbi:Kif28p, partial [Symbiodinium pilosum]
SFYITYSGFGCNLDMHQQRLGDLIYLHILPDTGSQRQLFNLVSMVNAAFQHAGIKVNHPRKSLFHLTLLRANSSYPVDAVVGRLHDVGSTTIQVYCFYFNGQQFLASDGCAERQLCSNIAV